MLDCRRSALAPKVIRQDCFVIQKHVSNRRRRGREGLYVLRKVVSKGTARSGLIHDCGWDDGRTTVLSILDDLPMLRLRTIASGIAESTRRLAHLPTCPLSRVHNYYSVQKLIK